MGGACGVSFIGVLGVGGDATGYEKNGFSFEDPTFRAERPRAGPEARPEFGPGEGPEAAWEGPAAEGEEPVSFAADPAEVECCTAVNHRRSEVSPRLFFITICPAGAPFGVVLSPGSSGGGSTIV